jgi:hypothetical protein
MHGGEPSVYSTVSTSGRWRGEEDRVTEVGGGGAEEDRVTEVGGGGAEEDRVTEVGGAETRHGGADGSEA